LHFYRSDSNTLHDLQLEEDHDKPRIAFCELYHTIESYNSVGSVLTSIRLGVVGAITIATFPDLEKEGLRGGLCLPFGTTLGR